MRYSKEYENANINSEFIDFISKIKSGDYKDNDIFYLGFVRKKQAGHYKQISGLDLMNYKIAIEARQLAHILKDHGRNGKEGSCSCMCTPCSW